MTTRKKIHLPCVEKALRTLKSPSHPSLQAILDDPAIFSTKQLYELGAEADYDVAKLEDNLSPEDYKLFIQQAHLSENTKQLIKADGIERLGTAVRVLSTPLTCTIGLGSSIAEQAIATAALSTMGIIKLALLGTGAIAGVIVGAVSAIILKREAKRILREKSHRELESYILQKANEKKSLEIEVLGEEIFKILAELKVANILEELVYTQDKIYETRAGILHLSQSIDDALGFLNFNEELRQSILTDRSYKNAKAKIEHIANETIDIVNTDVSIKNVYALPDVAKSPLIHTSKKMHYGDINPEVENNRDLNINASPKPFNVGDWLREKDTKRSVGLQVAFTWFGSTAGNMVFAGFLALLGVTHFILPVLLPVSIVVGGIFAASYFYGLYRNGQRNHELNHVRTKIESQKVVKTRLGINI